nr:hypothetical protein [Thalassotalea atypica]
MAVFIMVVMLMLGVALVRMLSSSAETIAYEVLGTRAYNIANTGLQAKMAEIFPLGADALRCNGGSTSTLVDGAAPAATVTLVDYKPSLANVEGLRNCTVTQLTCSNFKQDAVVYYQLSSVGECQIDGANKTSRTIVVEARSLK